MINAYSANKIAGPSPISPKHNVQLEALKPLIEKLIKAAAECNRHHTELTISSNHASGYVVLELEE